MAIANNDHFSAKWITQEHWERKYPNDAKFNSPATCEYCGGYRNFSPREMLDELKESIARNFEASGDARFRDILEMVLRKEVGNENLYSLYTEARFRNMWLNYESIARLGRDAKFSNGISLEVMGTPPSFCAEWCREHPEYSPETLGAI